ncbi:LytR C-terminal domain-containing protein [uncultured Slackia sp.]|uniref:LytR C-terminal domain-containing protein n=1 Tax=uncultured Slackia sp. TaxID=665903 RepID=UPI0025E1366B|nr:LytR C-terminal domain-containing protein [uncultured Slackia sp.]
MVTTHRFALTHTRAFLIRLAALALAVTCLFALSACGHEPEIATPPADYGQEQTEQQDNAAKTNDDAEAADADKEAKEEEAEKPVHEGPFVVSILNAGGADGLAGAAQEKLATDGIEGSNYEISVDSYLAAVMPTTTVYVTGEGDDAEEVRAEADKIAKALGGEVKTFKSGELAEGTTMDGLDILVLVGADAI